MTAVTAILLLALATIAVLAIIGTLVVAARDGHRRAPFLHHERRPDALRATTAR
jgi:hypothetical protein